ncbi:TIR domain-containing protein [Rhizohabitans arisaemae]|uniref:WD40 domain-containing protein n=1 Tax=Rhizohabitans arisaemae TaxID=2720610 RepID=UPI0024B11333|nr:TIR domain-containing protein [Rhizohabitans arisaemae]
MTRRGGLPELEGGIDFFISYSVVNERWATWIAWQLESAGYRTLIQAWDFVPGTDWVHFMDRGVRESTLVLALLSPSYLASPNCEREWRAVMGTDPGKLLTVRIEECRLGGLLSTITYLDLLRADDAEHARVLLLDRLTHALRGRAKPPAQPGFPGDPHQGTPAPESPRGRVTRARRTPAMAPGYPHDLDDSGSPRAEVSILHVAGPRFGRGLVDEDEPLDAGGLQARIWANLSQLVDVGAPRPDLLVVSGDLTESGRPSEIDEAIAFLTGLRALLGLEPHRLVVVPGSHDVSKAACLSYFADCEAREVAPLPPYYRKLEHYARLFHELYAGLDNVIFDSAQPWSLFAMPDLRLVVAGLNSTMAVTHLSKDDYGWIGEAQATWFAEQLRPYEQAGWLRIGAVRHDPAPGSGPVGSHPALLRDAGTLDRLLGRRLNLLLHGPGPGTTDVDYLGSDLPVLPGAKAGRDEIIHLTADGLTRWSVYDGRREHLDRPWAAAGGTFSAPQDEDSPELADPVEQAEPIRLSDPTSLLLDRVAEVCRTRHDRVKIRHVATDPPHLLVTRQDDGFNPQWRIGAHVGDPTREVIEAFARHAEGEGELVYQAASRASEALREEAVRRGVRLRSFTEFQGLLDMRDYVTKQTVRLRTDRRYPPGLYVPQRFRRLDDPGAPVREDLVAELVDLVTAEHGRFVLVLGDFGRGKTYSLREVARRLGEQRHDLIPILIELRALDKAHSVEGLVAAHLANHHEELIDLKAFQYMLGQGRIVLLFDGFDELVTRVTYDRAADHLDTLLQAAQGRAKIVVASRTQHFRSDAQVFTALGERVGLLPHRRILSVEEFSPIQIRSYLVNLYGRESQADARLDLIKSVEDLLGLARNPRMLSFIAQLSESRLRSAAQATHTISAALLYEEILTAWLRFEEHRTSGVPGAAGGLRLPDLWQAVTTLALRLWDGGEPYLRAAELNEIAGTLHELADRLSPEQRAHAMGAGSLLVRTDEGLFGFIHSSVAEWLVANAVAQQLREGVASPPQLIRRPLTQLTIDFLCDLADSRLCQDWIDRVLGDAEADEVARENAIKISTRLRTPPSAALRGASLQGQDLSHRRWQAVDLTGADLTGARLVGTNLTGATLRKANLTGARLDEAILVGADLTGADFTRAQLPRADLRDAITAGSRWTRAALINVKGSLNGPEFRGASVAPGRPIHMEFSPAEIGVPHGFDAELGRLPLPLSYSRDGGTLAIGSRDGGVMMCDSFTGQPLRTLQGHRGRVFAVVFGPAGLRLATGSSDGTVRLWDAATGEPLHVLAGHERWTWPVLFSPDASLIATGDAAGVLRLWDTATGDLVSAEPGGHGPIFTASFHPDGRSLATGHRSGAILIRDPVTGEAQVGPPAEPGTIYRVAFRPDGELLAVGGQDGSVRLWQGDRLRHTLSGRTGHIYTLNHHPREPLIAVGDTGGSIRIWDTDTGQVRHTLAVHEAAVYWVVFDPSGKLLASGDNAGGVHLWDVRTGEPRHSLRGHTGSIWPFAFRPDGAQLAVSDDQFTTRLWDTATGQCRHILRGHGRQVTSVRFSASGRSLATSCNDGIVRIWDPASGNLKRSLRGTEDRLVVLQTAVFSPTAPRLATVSNDGRVNLLNVTTGYYERYLELGTPSVWAVEFSPDGEVVATANDDDTVCLWTRSTGRLLRTLTEHRGRVRSIAYHPSGTVLATGCDDRRLRLFDAESGRLLTTMTGHTDRVYSIAFHGERLASGSWDGTVRLWDARSGRPVAEPITHGGRVWTIAFNPDGTLLATAGDDLTIRIWDPETGRLVHTVAGHTRSIWSVAFSPDGSLLASGSDDGTTRLWDMTGEPRLRLTLLGLPEGWAAIAPDGRYKTDGMVSGHFWHAVGTRRFEPGELDDHLPEVRRLPIEASFTDDPPPPPGV